MPLVSPDSLVSRASQLLEARFGPGEPPLTQYAPGRVNLIGEHIDYHHLPVLPMAIGRGTAIAFRLRHDHRILAVSEAQPSAPADFSLDSIGEAPAVPGHWSNYLQAAALVARRAFSVQRGLDAAIVSDLPLAAGLSSSSALLVAFTLSLLSANGFTPDRDALLSVLPDGEQFVGTRGGAMDHAAILASRAGHATEVQFSPLSISYIPVPSDWRFLVADSRSPAEKSAALRDHYNGRRQAGSLALQTLGYNSYRQALGHDIGDSLRLLPDQSQREAFLHVISEALRVGQSVKALLASDLPEFGRLLLASHRSLHERLRVTTEATNRLVSTAVFAGAAGARITGAGFGGCILAVCRSDQSAHVHEALRRQHFSDLSSSQLDRHLFRVEPANGALECSAALNRSTE